jgi:hypothetical protein
MNRVVHFEIHAKDMDNLQKFYQEVFGWEVKDMGEQMGNYRMVTTGKDEPGAMMTGINGGMVPRKGEAPKGGEPVNAFVCTISVANIDETLAKIEKGGGTFATDKMEIPGDMGTLAYRKDPEGNLFGIIQPIEK